ncbi:MAG: hypothetical protein IT345_11925 [Trueperaceae bacterium]|nr:hypothetical protein [Trueperaceae bacterium]
MRTHAPRRRDAEEVRCKGCGILLAKIDDGGLTIVRGDLQVTVTGEFQASIVCYRPRCRTLNVRHMRTGMARGAAT